MFGRHAKNDIDSLVGGATRLEGDLFFSGGLRIDGEVYGNVIASDGDDNLLVVSEHARIEGEVRCANVVVNGVIEGTVYCSELLEVQTKGRIVGDVHYKLLEMHGGALVTGKLSHQELVEPACQAAVAEAEAEGA